MARTVLILAAFAAAVLLCGCISQEEDSLTYTPFPPATEAVHGRVLWVENSTPVANIRVFIKGNRNMYVDSMLSTSEGRFYFFPLPSQRYVIRATLGQRYGQALTKGDNSSTDLILVNANPIQ